MSPLDKIDDTLLDLAVALGISRTAAKTMLAAAKEMAHDLNCERLQEIMLEHDLRMTGHCFWTEHTGRKVRVDPAAVVILLEADRAVLFQNSNCVEVRHMSLNSDVLAELASAHIAPPETVKKVNEVLDRADREIRDLRRQIQDTRSERAEATERLERYRKDAERWRWIARHLTQLVVTTDQQWLDDADVLEVQKIEYNSEAKPTDVESVAKTIDRLMEVVK
jgi:hypothetical protein